MTPGILFDMDGVLVASSSAHAASWRIVARRQGVAMSDEQFRETFGQTSRDIIRRFWGDGISAEQIAQIDHQKEAAYRELITGMVPLTIGARETLHSLRAAGFPLAVATSGPPENVELVLNETRLSDVFSAIVTGADVARGKPAPDCFVLAAQRLGCDSRDCVVVEDAPVGIEAGRAAGARVIGFVGTHSAQRLIEAGADAIVDRLNQITPEHVRSLLAEKSA